MQLDIYEVGSKNKKDVWGLFRKYHYLNTELSSAARLFVGVFNNELVCCAAILHFPMRKGWKRVHRLVVLPDYQGVGIGTSFIQKIADLTTKEGFRLNLTTSTPALTKALLKSRHWALCRYGRVKPRGDKKMRNTLSIKRITYSFNYLPEH